jgi:hypothetical protein
LDNYSDYHVPFPNHLKLAIFNKTFVCFSTIKLPKEILQKKVKYCLLGLRAEGKKEGDNSSLKEMKKVQLSYRLSENYALPLDSCVFSLQFSTGLFLA